MYEENRYEYTVRTCPTDDAEVLEDMLNEMSASGWELYSLNEAENDEGEYRYLCIFSRQPNGEYGLEYEYTVDAGDFKTTMKRLLTRTDDLYKECRYLQKELKEKNRQISEIKQSLDSGENIDRDALNNEISEKMNELKVLKSRLSELISPSAMYNRINQDLLTIVVSYELSELIDSEKDGDLIAESVKLRQKLTDELGYVIPGIHFTISDEMNENEYGIKVRNLSALGGVVYPGYKRFFPGQSNLEKMPGDAVEDIDIISGRECFWLEEDKTRDFWDNGLSPSQVIIAQLEFAARKYVDEILGYRDILNYINILEDAHTFLVEELFKSGITLGDLRYILAGLIRESVSVRDIVFIFEKLNDLAGRGFNGNDELLEQLRVFLKRQICSSVADDNNVIYAMRIPEKFRGTLARALKNKNGDGLSGLVEHISRVYRDTRVNVILSEPRYRKCLFDLLENVIPGVSVISEKELAEEFTLEQA